MHNLTNVLDKVSPIWPSMIESITDIGAFPAVSAVPESSDSDVHVSDRNLFGGLNFIVGDIDDASTLDPFTHIYMYDLGFPPPLQQSIAKKFNDSVHCVGFVSYRPPIRVIGISTLLYCMFLYLLINRFWPCHSF